MKPSNLPNGWQEVELNKICTTASGGTPSRAKKEYWENGAIPWIKSGDLNKDKITEVDEFITELGLKESSAKYIEPDTVLIAMYGATAGKTSISKIRATTNQAVCALVPDKKILNKDYLLWWLRSKYKYIVSLSFGGGQPNISQQVVRSLKILLPPLSVQKKIVSILEKAESLKQKREEADKKTNEYLKSVFYEMFGNLVVNDKKFEIKELNEICDVRDGTHASPEYVEEGYPLITSKNLTNGIIDFSNVNLISRKDFDEINRRSKVDSGDILMPMIGTIGNPVIVPQNVQEFAIKNVALIKFTKTNVLNIFIQFLLDGEYFDAITKENNRGGTQKFIALGDIRKIPVPLPPLTLQEKFASIVEKVEKLKEKQKESKEKINEMFDVLMQKAFRGEL